jgi:hypothetical protein
MPQLEASRIGEFYGDPRKGFFAELMIDIEEDLFTRAVIVGMLPKRELSERCWCDFSR